MQGVPQVLARSLRDPPERLRCVFQRRFSGSRRFYFTHRLQFADFQPTRKVGALESCWLLRAALRGTSLRVRVFVRAPSILEQFRVGGVQEMTFTSLADDENVDAFVRTVRHRSCIRLPRPCLCA